jgi:phosphate/sulfate permease
VIQHTVQIEKIIGDNALLCGQIDCGGRLIATVGSLIAVVRPAADMAASVPAGAPGERLQPG